MKTAISVVIAMLTVLSVAAADFSIKDDSRNVVVMDGNQPVLRYRYAEVTPPDGVPSRYRRACYIHPLYGLDGEILTEDFPKDHRHHRGVFWAWPAAKVGDRLADIWELIGIRQRHERWLLQTADKNRAELRVSNIWSFDKTPETPLVRETVDIVVMPADEYGRNIDFSLKFKNVCDEPVTFQGSQVKNKGYGGFGIRPDSSRKPMHFTTVQGPVSEDKTRFATPWADLSFPFKERGTQSGFAIFQHPGNPDYPHDGWLFRHYGFLGASWPHLKPYVLEPGRSFELRYRLYVHRGDAEKGRVKQSFSSFIEESSRQ